MARPVIVLRNLLVMLACFVAGAAGMRYAINYLPEGPKHKDRQAGSPGPGGGSMGRTPTADPPAAYEFAPWHEYSLALSDTIGPGLPEPRSSWLASAVAELPPRTAPQATSRPAPRVTVATNEISFMELRAGQDAPEPPPIRMAVVPMVLAAVPDAGNVADLKLRGRFDPDRPTAATDPTFDACGRWIIARPAEFPRPPVAPVFVSIPDPFATSAEHAIRQAPPDDELPIESTAAPPRPVLPEKP
ncbi:MAG: hypothetical protein ACE15C_05535 [Phycisphaerae bacterium]